MAFVLIVDGDEPLSRLLTSVLTDGGHEATLAHGQPEGLRQMAERAPDWIVLDLGIADDADEFCSQAKAQGFQGRLVLLAAFGAKDAAARHNADAYLTKPFDPQDLLALLATESTCCSQVSQ